MYEQNSYSRSISYHLKICRYLYTGFYTIMNHFQLNSNIYNHRLALWVPIGRLALRSLLKSSDQWHQVHTYTVMLGKTFHSSEYAEHIEWIFLNEILSGFKFHGMFYLRYQFAICCHWFKWYNGLAWNRQQAIIWTNDGLVCWWIYASLNVNGLTHWGRDKMDAISQTTLSNPFSWMKIFDFWLKFHWSLFVRFQLTVFHHWFG